MNTGTNPATLADIVRARRVRKGKADGIDDNGAWWWGWPAEISPRIRSRGGDGVGQSAPSVTVELRARHYRCGRVVAGAWLASWHQNTGDRVAWVPLDGITDAATAEDVIEALARRGDDVWAMSRRGDVEIWAAAVGLPLAPASPDDVEGGGR